MFRKHRRSIVLLDSGDVENEDKENEEGAEGSSEPEGPETGLAIERAVKDTEVQAATPMSTMSTILAQRKEAMAEIERAEKEAKEGGNDEEGSSDGEGSEDGDENSDGDGEDGEGEDGDDKKSEDGDGKEGEEKDDDDDDDLDDMEFDDPADEVDEDGGDVATEDSNGGPVFDKSQQYPKGFNFFKSLRGIMDERCLALESMGHEVTPEMKEPDGETSIAYTEEGIVEALAMIGEINRKYIDRGKNHIEKVEKSLPKLNERVMNFQRGMAEESFTYTNKMVSEVDLLTLVSFDEVSDPRETLKRLRKYTRDSNDISGVMVNTEFDKMKDVFMAKHFVDKGELIEYGSMIPGFIIVKANIPTYKSYLSTKVTDYQYFMVSESNPTEMYNLQGISITEDKEAAFITEGLKGLITDAALSLDILKVIIKAFEEYMDSLKILRVEVQDHAYDKLSEIDLDGKIKQFVMFKMAIELLTTNINVIYSYVNAMAGVLDICVAFKQPKEVEGSDE